MFDPMFDTQCFSTFAKYHFFTRILTSQMCRNMIQWHCYWNLPILEKNSSSHFVGALVLTTLVQSEALSFLVPYCWSRSASLLRPHENLPNRISEERRMCLFSWFFIKSDPFLLGISMVSPSVSSRTHSVEQTRTDSRNKSTVRIYLRHFSATQFW